MPKQSQCLLPYGWIYAKPESHAWEGGLSSWMNLPIDKGRAVFSGWSGLLLRCLVWCPWHGWWDHCLSGEGEGRGSALPAQAEECLSAGSNCIPAAEEPRNERVNNCTKLLHWGKYREVFHMVACSTKPLNISTWGNSCHPDPGYFFPSCLIIAD